MLTTVIAVALLGGPVQQKPGALVSQMFARYHSLNTLSGKLSYSQSAKDSDGKEYASHGETTLQFEAPNKLYIYQTSDVQNAAPGRIVSNGYQFLYGIPQDTRDVARTIGTVAQQNSELVENVVQFNYGTGQNDTIDIGQMYAIGRAGLPLHPAVPLDIAINRHDDLKAFTDQLATVEAQGDATINGQHAHLIGGQWRQYADAPPSGVYQFAITDSGDLLRYILRETVSGAGVNPNGAVVRAPAVTVTTIWNVDLKPNGEVDEKLFNDRNLKQAARTKSAATQTKPTGGEKPPQ